MGSVANHLKYNQARLDILGYIVSHQLQVGDRLPPERFFAGELNCSIGTMRIALKELEENGLIEKRHGCGSYLQRQVSETAPAGVFLYISVVHSNEGCIYPPAFLNQFLSSRGFQLDQLSVRDVGDIPRERLEHCLGIILSGWLSDDFVRNLQALEIPLVVVGNTSLSVDVPVFSVDMTGVSARLTRHFIESGRRNIVFWGGVRGYISLQEAYAGYRKEMKSAGLEPQVMKWDASHPCRRVAEFLHAHPETEVMIAEQMAFGEYSMARSEDPEIGALQFGLLPVLQSGRYMQGKNVVFGDFQENCTMMAAGELCKAVSGQGRLQSKVASPVLHGIDDHLGEFSVI